MRHMRLQLVADEYGQIDISGETKTTKTLFVLLNRPHTLQGWYTTHYTFHSEIGVHSVLRVANDVFRTR